jgi:EmrB/QacA subfamily drug resistance transporter
MRQSTQGQVVDHRLKWYVMASVSMGVFLGTIDGSIVNVALPTLVQDLQTDFPTIQWVVLAYLLTQGTLMLSVGRLGDMIGKKHIYVLGYAIFTFGSFLCGLAPTVQWLIASRVLQALGGSMTAALGVAIVIEAFPSEERGKALGVIGTVVSLGIVLGPTLGGVILLALSWHWIFFVNLPIGIVGIVMVLIYVPNFKPKTSQRFDFVGSGTMFISLCSFLLALTIGQRIGFSSRIIFLLFLSSIFFLIVFIFTESKVKHPVIDLHMFRNILFSINLLNGSMVFIALAGGIFLLPFYLENVMGLEPQVVGLVMAALPALLGITAPISGVLSDRYGTRPMTVLGLIILVIGYSILRTIDSQTTVFGMIWRILPLGMGVGFFQSPNNSAVMGSVLRERLGVASGLLGLTRVIGQTTGIAILGALWTTRVFSYVGDNLPGGATTASIQAQVAGLKDTIGIQVFLMLVAMAGAVWAWKKEWRRDNVTQTIG